MKTDGAQFDSITFSNPFATFLPAMTKRRADSTIVYASSREKMPKQETAWLPIPGFRDVEMNAQGVVRRASDQTIIKMYNSAVELILDNGQRVSRGVRKIKVQLFPCADLEGEEWRVTKQFPAYEVSNRGRVRSLNNKHMIALQLSKGYCRIGTGTEGPMVHVLVGKAFLPPPTRADQTTVNHKNGIKTDNHIDNLEWMSQSEQLFHAHATGLHSRNSTYQTSVHQLKDNVIIATFRTIADAARASGATESNIRAVCQSKRHTAAGYGFAYVNQDRESECIPTITTPEQNAWNWVSIQDFPSYEICPEGLVRNAGTHRVLSYQLIEGDYKKVTLYKSTGENTPRPLHILLAKAFIPNPHNLPVVNHIDENKVNNDLGNLEWVTHQRNTEASLGKTVFQYDDHRQLLQSWPSAEKASLSTGIPVSTMSRYCRLPVPSMHRGFMYSYMHFVPTNTVLGEA